MGGTLGMLRVGFQTLLHCALFAVGVRRAAKCQRGRSRRQTPDPATGSDGARRRVPGRAVYPAWGGPAAGPRRRSRRTTTTPPATQGRKAPRWRCGGASGGRGGRGWRSICGGKWQDEEWAQRTGLSVTLGGGADALWVGARYVSKQHGPASLLKWGFTVGYHQLSAPPRTQLCTSAHKCVNHIMACKNYSA